MRESGQSLTEYVLILVLVAIVVFLVMFLVGDVQTRHVFDAKVDEQPSLIVGNVQSVETESVMHPNPVLFVDVPGSTSSGLMDHPRSWNLEGCIEVRLPKTAKHLYAATPVPSEIAGLINIQMPIPGGSVINICAPGGISTQIFLWID